ncbi:unnamed protein product [Rotaria sordida]|uniref:NR LBD domain-containing protein n=1 Tax=Rotaria sordida TaxID=392033 RepID=A0A818LLC0_9BILA|nr:unnamed protein product [Rotaria sordida]CAF3576462.1 unnamed protein product [Rotaria sordida]CAF3856917.1 unnamed protein product [Rotaria sordida]
MIPATAVPSHPINTLDRIAFYKSVREKRKQLQLNHHTNGKDNVNSSTENAFLTQMLQSSSNSTTPTSISSSLSIPTLLRKGDFSSSHRTVTSTLTNILPALLNGTLQSPRAISPSGTTTNIANLNSPTSTNTTDTLVDIKCSTSLPVSPAANIYNNNLLESSNDNIIVPTNYSPPRCRSYPMTVLSKRTSPSTSNVPSTQATSVVQSIATSTSYLLATASSCPSLTNSTMATINSSTSPSPDDTVPKIVRSASVKSCASDSGVSSSSPLSDNNIVHVFRTNHIETINQPQVSTGGRKRKSLAHFYDELSKDKKFSTEATVSSGFAVPTTTTTTTATATTINNNNNNNNNNNIPYSQQEAIAIGYAQYALMHSLTQQFRVNYPAAFLHAAAASGYLPIPPPMMAAAVAAAASANSNTNGNNSLTTEKFRERRKQQQQQQPESDNNNNHIRSISSVNDQPYRRETYQTLLESSRLLGQQKLLKPVPIDLRKHNGGSRTIDNSPISSNIRYPSSSSSTSPSGSPSCLSPSKSNNIESINDYVCIPKKLMPVIGARINDWLERNVNFTLSLHVIQETIDNDKDKFLLLSHIWHRLLIISMIENSFEIYVTKDLQITNDLISTTTHLPTENDVKQIESLITRGKTLEIDEMGFNLIREVIIYKEGKTLFENSSVDSFEKAECQAQTRLTTWCSSRVRYSKIVFFLCNIYQVKEDIFERLFCSGSMHQSTPIHTYLERFLASASSSSTSMDDA